MKIMNLTYEQNEIINCNFDNILLINAFAGTWKTTTLVEFCKARPNDKILYLCYNRWLKEEAIEKFKDLNNVKVSTIHSIAYNSIWFNFKQRLWNLRPYDLSIYYQNSAIKYYYGFYSLLILHDFLNSSDNFNYYINEYLPKNIDNLLKGYPNRNNNLLINWFKKIWNDILNSESIKVEHDVYLKLFQLNNPDLNIYDYILVDEAQDVNLCMLDIVLKQKTKKVFIGDSFQQIYQWRWSKNTFKLLESEKDKINLSLTWSFRCAKNITDIANNYLKVLWADTVIEWLNKKRTNLDNVTIIWRTNASIMRYTIENKWSIYYVWWFDSYSYWLLLDINYLYYNEINKISNSFIKLFTNHNELVKYSTEWSDIEIKNIIKLFEDIISWKININTYRWVDDIEQLVKLLKKEASIDYLYSDYAITTAHKSKWLEWQNIVLLDDFINVSFMDTNDLFLCFKFIFNKNDVKIKLNYLEELYQELNILYVASTRAKQKIIINDKYILNQQCLNYILENIITL